MEERARGERPGIITAVCVLGFVSAASAVVNMFSPYVKALGPSFQAYYVVVALLSPAALIGFWKMKKWGVILYALTTTSNVIVLWLVWHFNPVAVLVGWALNMVFVITGIYYFSKMD